MSVQELKCWEVYNSVYSFQTHLMFCFLLSTPHPVHSLLKSAFNSIAIEKEKLKQMVSEQEHNKGQKQMARLRQSLAQVNERICFTLTHPQPSEAKDGGRGSPTQKGHIHLKFSQDTAMSGVNINRTKSVGSSTLSIYPHIQ